MKVFDKAVDTQPLQRIVLVLQGDIAYWFKLVDQKVVASFTEYILGDCIELAAQCPWVNSASSSAPLFVELVLDTTLDEVDRVGVAQSRSSIVNWYRTVVTLVRLRKHYQQSRVYELPVRVDNNVASLMHPAIPEHWVSWLLMLQGTHLVFHRVATGSELATSASRHFHDYRLLVMPVAGYERHMLVLEGSVVFLRTVPAAKYHGDSSELSLSEHSTTVDESIQYIESAVMLDRESIVVMEPCDGVELHKNVVHSQAANATSTLPATDKVTFYLALMAGLNCHFEPVPVSAGNGGVSSQATTAPLRKNPSSATSSGLTKLTTLAHTLSGYGSKLMHHWFDEWSLKRSVLRHLDALHPSLNYVKASRRIACIQGVSVMFLLLAIASFSAALFNGVSNKRLIHQDLIQQAAISEAESELYDTVASLFERPRVGADSLFIADELTQMASIAPEVLLEEVATVMTSASDVQLDRLVWTHVDNGEAYESLSHLLDSVPARSAINRTISSAVVQLELSGRVIGETLKKQQKILSEFVGQLKAIHGAVEAHILESPIDDALTSGAGDDKQGRYRVSLKLSAR